MVSIAKTKVNSFKPNLRRDPTFGHTLFASVWIRNYSNNHDSDSNSNSNSTASKSSSNDDTFVCSSDDKHSHDQHSTTDDSKSLENVVSKDRNLQKFLLKTYSKLMFNLIYF